MKENNSENKVLLVFIRYFGVLLIAITFSYSNFVYHSLLYLTIYPLKLILGFFYPLELIGNMLFISPYTLEIIPACVAVSAYMLLLILNLTTPMSPKKRLYSILFSVIALLCFNILRIALFSVLMINNYAYYDLLHKLFWYFFSILLVVCIWFFSAFIFKIKAIPVYSDFSLIWKLLRHKKNYKPKSS